MCPGQHGLVVGAVHRPANTASVSLSFSAVSSWQSTTCVWALVGVTVVVLWHSLPVFYQNVGLHLENGCDAIDFHPWGFKPLSWCLWCLWFSSIMMSWCLWCYWFRPFLCCGQVQVTGLPARAHSNNTYSSVSRAPKEAQEKPLNDKTIRGVRLSLTQKRYPSQLTQLTCIIYFYWKLIDRNLFSYPHYSKSSSTNLIFTIFLSLWYSPGTIFF